ncbi:MAG: T9SS type A sorting domain-containing protein [Chlorobi bacterium]|nr:T9SS type A sorting domain-containing protein [Chlorobiota bacterium]
MKYISLTILLIVIFACRINAQYISGIIEYTPAPGQFINTDSYGSPDAALSIIGTTNGIVSLGAFGGYIIFKFENPVENDPENPYGIDFTVFGNPASAESSEPGIVSVMKDENNNGLPDDTWYELAGSDYFFSNTIHNYGITYNNPQQEEAADVAWTDNTGNSGFVYANSYHTQPYYPSAEYFPDIDQNAYSLEGTKIIASVDTSNPGNIKSYCRSFGYADNKIRGDINSNVPDNPYTADTEGMGGDSFDISWAVDQNGNYADLDEIDFVKVHCGVNADMMMLGELSTEISGAVDISPDQSISGTELSVVIKDLPPQLYTDTSYTLEVFAFNKGRLQSYDINTELDLDGAYIDEDNILNLTQPGTLTITAYLTDNPDIGTSITREVYEPESIGKSESSEILIYPVPANNFFEIKNINKAEITITDNYGRTVKKVKYNGNKIDVSSLPSGIYFIITETNETVTSEKLIIAK